MEVDFEETLTGWKPVPQGCEMYKKKRIEETEKRLKGTRPKSKESLHDYIKYFLDVDVPTQVFSEGHKTPMDYIWFSFNADFEEPPRQNADCVVWASRGGGKTLVSAIITLLDVIFKPEIQVRILSGSGYQAGRLYEYFQGFCHLNYEDEILDERRHPVKKTIMKNGASVEVFVQTEVSVRGQHVHKLRCDEVELFKPKVYEASQYTTMSNKGYVAAREVISTMHRRRGLMKRLIDEGEGLGQPVFKWNIWEVVEKCVRNCKGCKLKDYCNGKAKNGSGYYKISDIITQLERAGKRSFDMEMMCGDAGKKKSIWDFRSRLY